MCGDAVTHPPARPERRRLSPGILPARGKRYHAERFKEQCALAAASRAVKAHLT